MDKRELRMRIAEMEAELSEDYIRESDAGIFENIISLPEYISAKSIFIYCSVKREADTRKIIKHALKDGKRVALPKIVGKSEMKALEIHGLEDLVPGPIGLVEPPVDAEELEEADIVIAPATAFSLAGDRLGKGGGFYDKYLTDKEVFSVGIAREMVVLENIVPVEAHDVPVMCIVTEKSVRRFV